MTANDLLKRLVAEWESPANQGFADIAEIVAEARAILAAADKPSIGTVHAASRSAMRFREDYFGEALAVANAYAPKQRIMRGDDGRYWVVTAENAEILAAAGFEFAPKGGTP